jgi:hypothetical protein
MYCRRKAGALVYCCQRSGSTSRTVGCDQSINADRLHDLITTKALALLDDDRVIRRLLVANSDERDVALAVEEEALGAKLARIDDARDDGIYDKPEWLKRRTPVADRLGQVQKERASLHPKRAWLRLGDNPIGLWLAGDLRQRQHLLGLVVERVIVKPARRRNAFDPGRIQVVPVPELLGDAVVRRIVRQVLAQK